VTYLGVLGHGLIVDHVSELRLDTTCSANIF